MARRIRWQIITTVVCGLLILLLLGHLALSTVALGDPAVGGTYSEALVGSVGEINPLRGNLQTGPEADISSLLFEGLTRIETNGLVAPALATAWEIDASARIYTVNLRPNVTWHDGAAFSAADVVWTLDWIHSPDFNGDPALQAVWASIEVAAIDATTVEFTLPAPFAPFPNQLTLPILPAHLLRDASADQWAAFGRAPVGTGAYFLSSLTTDQVDLSVYPNYRAGNGPDGSGNAALPNLQVIQFRLYSSLDAAYLALRRGDVDALAYNVTEHDELALLPAHQRVRAPLADYVVLTFNLREPPLNDLAVRQAISYAIDQQQIIDGALGGRALPLLTPILPSSWAWNPDLVPYTDNAAHDRANAALDDAGWVRGSDGGRTKNGTALVVPLLTANTPERIAVAQAIADQLALIGIVVEVQSVDAPTLAQRLTEHDFGLVLHGWTNLGSDPDVYELWHSSQIDAANYAGLADSDIDRLLIDARQTADLDTRTQLYMEFQTRWLALAPSIILYEPLLEQQTADSIQVLGLAAQAINSEILYQPSDRFRRLNNWYASNTRQFRSNLRQNPGRDGPR